VAEGERRSNVEDVLTDGSSLPMESESADFAFSDQFLEHLHPEDAREHLREVVRVLKPGGIYMCVTPNRLSGPHDISGYFDDVAQGLHLKEYSACELIAALRASGFRSVDILAKAGTPPVPLWRVRLIESILGVVPISVRRNLAARKPDAFIHCICAIARK
jgi:SAM-dependent methyltransferase